MVTFFHYLLSSIHPLFWLPVGLDVGLVMSVLQYSFGSPRCPPDKAQTPSSGCEAWQDPSLASFPTHPPSPLPSKSILKPPAPHTVPQMPSMSDMPKGPSFFLLRRTYSLWTLSFFLPSKPCGPGQLGSRAW